MLFFVNYKQIYGACIYKLYSFRVEYKCNMINEVIIKFIIKFVILIKISVTKIKYAYH